MKMMSCEVRERRFASKISFIIGEETSVFVSKEAPLDSAESMSPTISIADSESAIALLYRVVLDSTVIIGGCGSAAFD